MKFSAKGTEASLLETRKGPRKSCWGVAASLANPPLSVIPGAHRSASQSHAYDTAIQTTHEVNKSSNASHITRRKENFNSHNIPTQEYLSSVASWAQEMGCTKDHKLISNCLDFVDSKD